MWAVTSGAHSDYRVLCVCDSKERAEQIAAIPAEGYRNAYQADSFLYMDDDPVLVTIHGLTCEIRDDGTATEQSESVRSEWDFDTLYPQYHVASFVRWVRAPVHGVEGGWLEVNGTDLDAVRHVFSDMRAQLLTDDVLRGRKYFERKGRP